MMRLYRDSNYSQAATVIIRTVASLVLTQFNTYQSNGYVKVEWDVNLDEEVKHFITDSYTKTTRECTEKEFSLRVPIGTIVKIDLQCISPYYNSVSRSVTLIALDKGIGVMVIGSTFFIGDQPNSGIGSTNYVVGSTLIVA